MLISSIQDMITQWIMLFSTIDVKTLFLVALSITKGPIDCKGEKSKSISFKLEKKIPKSWEFNFHGIDQKHVLSVCTLKFEL